MAQHDQIGQLFIYPPNRTEQRHVDRHLYQGLNLIERFVCRIKLFRRISTRYDKLDRSYEAFIANHCRLDLARPMSNRPWAKGKHRGIPRTVEVTHGHGQWPLPTPLRLVEA